MAKIKVCKKLNKSFYKDSKLLKENLRNKDLKNLDKNNNNNNKD